MRRAARSPIAYDGRSVERTCDGQAKSSRVRCDGLGGGSLPPLSPSLLGLGIGEGKGWEVVLKYGIMEGRGVPKCHTWVPNIETVTSLREGLGGKSPLSFLCSSVYCTTEGTQCKNISTSAHNCSCYTAQTS